MGSIGKARIFGDNDGCTTTNEAMIGLWAISTEKVEVGKAVFVLIVQPEFVQERYMGLCSSSNNSIWCFRASPMLELMFTSMIHWWKSG